MHWELLFVLNCLNVGEAAQSEQCFLQVTDAVTVVTNTSLASDE